MLPPRESVKCSLSSSPSSSRADTKAGVCHPLVRRGCGYNSPLGRAKNVKEIGFSAFCGERKQTPRFDVSRWNYGVVIGSMEGHLLLGVHVPESAQVQLPSTALD